MKMIGLLLSSMYVAAAGTISIVGGSIGGNGTISATVEVGAGGSLDPGATVGTLPIDGNLDVLAMANGGSGKLSFGLGALAGTNDKITITGTLTLGTGILGFDDFAFTNLGGVEPGTYTLITSNTIAGSLDATKLRGPISAFTGTIAINGNNIELAIRIPTPYEVWAYGFLPADVINPAANLDADSLTNLQEYAFGCDPTQATSAITIDESGIVTNTNGTPIAYLAGLTANTVDYRAVFSRRKDFSVTGLSYTVEFSTLGSGGPWVASTAIPAVMNSTNADVDVVYVPYLAYILTAIGRYEKPRFFRISVAQ